MAETNIYIQVLVRGENSCEINLAFYHSNYVNIDRKQKLNVDLRFLDIKTSYILLYTS